MRGDQVRSALCAPSGAVHPRMRGDQGRDQFWVMLRIGSSPHARGSVSQVAGEFPEMRFIPACAGIRRSLLAVRSRFTVHPRMRGDQRESRMLLRLRAGSSPHARGSAIIAGRRRQIGRFIPACAGISTGISINMGACSVHPRMRGDQLDAQAESRVRVGSSPHARGSADQAA